MLNLRKRQIEDQQKGGTGEGPSPLVFLSARDLEADPEADEEAPGIQEANRILILSDLLSLPADPGAAWRPGC